MAKPEGKKPKTPVTKTQESISRHVLLRHTDLEGLDKSPEEGPNAFAFTEQFDQPQDSEQTEEGDGHFPTLTFTLEQESVFRQKNIRRYSPNFSRMTHLELSLCSALTSP